MSSCVGEGSVTREAFLQLDYFHALLHRLPHISVVLVVPIRTSGKLVRGHYKLLALELLLELCIFVIADRSTQTLAHTLEFGKVAG